jgi:hypothetical protein
MAAHLTNEQWFKIRQRDVIRPALGADLDVMGAFVIAAVDQEPTKARRSHFPKRDFLFAVH